ncbi:CaiB/BaiF CoA transferase family protein [Pseudooceanicola sp. LIPI14-2-Ac024]|uniref:CaiB/BaiF CoA transferase family protein n=1 Tax=Pseudooceanicola sp. LIPI14-2-Ac024 TaxID=3344875 RepID=UPI0035D10AF5
MSGDLSGLLVVSVEQAVAAPYASGRLAAAGARVIKVERPEGDFAREYDHLVHGESAYFVWLNHGKESLCLDLREAADAAVLHSIIAEADVFIQNLAPGAIARLGFDQAELRVKHPRLITVAISGYGDDGPYRDHKAYDLLVQAESGLSKITGNEAGSARVGVSVCDISAGMTAYTGILQALIGRGITGKGRHVSVSLFHALSDWMNVPYLQYAYGGKEPALSGLNHPTIAPYGVFVGSDGGEILLSIQNEREWAWFCDKVLERPEVAVMAEFNSNTQRVANRPALKAIIDEVFARHPVEELARRLLDARIAYGRVNGMKELMAHPQTRTVEVQSPSGPVTMLAHGAVTDGPDPHFGTVPALGEHSDAIRAEFNRR